MVLRQLRHLFGQSALLRVLPPVDDRGITQ
ncbi:hypothetical protein EDD90_2641 [Streptomyces sp. Ag109_O5-1]|nr:hypothetical protein EDD90_2641 [Streptomyces sp. Ag109_O5-1]